MRIERVSQRIKIVGRSTQPFDDVLFLLDGDRAAGCEVPLDFRCLLHQFIALRQGRLEAVLGIKPVAHRPVQIGFHVRELILLGHVRQSFSTLRELAGESVSVAFLQQPRVHACTLSDGIDERFRFLVAEVLRYHPDHVHVVCLAC